MDSIWSTDHPQDLVLPKGTALTWTRVWSRRESDGSHTPMFDVTVTMTKDTVITEAITELEEETLSELNQLGSKYLRQYYIEGFLGLGTDKVEIQFGT